MRTRKLTGATLAAVGALFWTHSVVLADEASASNLQEQVDAAVVAARQSYLGPTYDLKNKGALRYFEKYAADPDQIVRTAVIDIAAADRTAEAVKVLTPLVCDPSVGVQAVNALYEFDKPLLTQVGGEALKAALLSVLKTQPYGFSGKAALLLTCFPNDADVVTALKNLKQGSLGGPTAPQDLSPKSALPVDLALSELGDAATMHQVQAVIRQGDVDLLPVLLDDLKFVGNRATLASLIPLLDDKHDTKSGIFISVGFMLLPAPDKHGNSKALPASPASKPQATYFRVCDIALLRLAQKTGVDVGIPDVMIGIEQHDPILTPRRYTDAELNLAYSRLSAFLKGAGE